jgi:hypothetical protein
VRRLALALGAAVISTVASAAGIDSQSYTCGDLQTLIASRGFVFISQATFGDFVVASVSYCPGGSVLQTRSVATRDNAQCLVDYCVSPAFGRRQ